MEKLHTSLVRAQRCSIFSSWYLKCNLGESLHWPINASNNFTLQHKDCTNVGILQARYLEVLSKFEKIQFWLCCNSPHIPQDEKKIQDLINKYKNAILYPYLHVSNWKRMQVFRNWSVVSLYSRIPGFWREREREKGVLFQWIRMESENIQKEVWLCHL